MARKALVAWGGWDGHQPDLVGQLFAEILEGEGFDVSLQNGLDGLLDAELVKSLSLFVPVITMSEITGPQMEAIGRAVAEDGVGIAGCHGGMCDSFRTNTEWQFMTGGQWVSHPGNDGVKYHINFVPGVSHPITEGLEDFEVASEQYYLHTDPGNFVLATCDFPTAGVDGPHVANPCKMPQVWVKTYGKGRVFYNALGHQANIFDIPTARELMRRGFLWAAKD